MNERLGQGSCVLVKAEKLQREGRGMPSLWDEAGC